MTRTLLRPLATAAALGLMAAPLSASSLEEIRERDLLRCGVSSSVSGFADTDTNDEWQGFDVGICRAVAAAVLRDPNKVEFVEKSSDDRYTDLASGKVDMLVDNTPWTFSRDVAGEFEFAGVSYYDGQGFLVPRSLNVASARDLDRPTVCIVMGSSDGQNAMDFFQQNAIEFTAVPVQSNADAQAAYLEGACQVYTTSASRLAAMRASLGDPTAHVVLPEIISKEPLGPVVRHGDNEWGDVVRWTLYLLITAEELGITSANVKELAQGSGNPAIDRVLGTQGNFGEQLGLTRDWAVTVIGAVGNYGELFERNIGENTPIGLARGLNAQWTNGGLLYSPPFR